MPGFRLLPLLLLWACTASSVQWEDSACGDLHRGDNLSLGDYIIQAADFSNERSLTPRVLLKLYNKSSFLLDQPLGQGESFSFDDSVRAEVENISIAEYLDDEYRGPCANVSLRLAAAPDLVLHIFSDKDTYNPGEEIELKLDIENRGTEDAEGINVTVSSDPELEELRGFRYRIAELGAGKIHIMGEAEGSKPKKIKLKAPCLPAPREYNVTARAEFSDTKGRSDEAWGGCVFSVTGQLQLHKYANDLMELGKNYPVILSLRNLGNETLAVDLSDEVGANFNISKAGVNLSIVKNNTLRSKKPIKVPPGDSVSCSYNVSPNTTAGAGADRYSRTLPAAKAAYSLGGKDHEVWSESPSVNVIDPLRGVRLQLQKYANDSMELGKEYLVILSLRNLGNEALDVNLSDEVGANFNITEAGVNLSVENNTTLHSEKPVKILPGDSVSCSYKVTPNAAAVADRTLPAAKATYSLRGEDYEVLSESPSVRIRDESSPGSASQGEQRIPYIEAEHRDLDGGQSENSSGPKMRVDASKGAEILDSRLQNDHLYLWALSAILLIFWLLGRIL